MASADVAAAEARVSAETATGVTSAKTRVTTSAPSVAASVLRPHRYREEKRERRDGHQAAHTALLYSRDQAPGAAQAGMAFF